MRTRTPVMGALLVLTSALAGAPPALATDARVTAGTVVVSSPAEELNAITISGATNGSVVVSDSRAAVSVAGPGCLADSGSQVTCSGVLRIRVQAGDLNDGVRNDTALPSTLAGGDGSDVLIGGLGADLLRGGGGIDILDGREGDDTFDVRGGLADQVTCGPGNDTVIADATDRANVDCETVDRGGQPPAPGEAPVPAPFSTGVSSIVLPSPPGTPVPIDVAPEIGGATLAAGACPTLFSGTDAADRVDGTGAGDRIFGLAGDDVLNGLGGGDCLFGGPGNDRVFGGAGGDLASGGLGADRVEGGADNDKLFGNGGSDRLYGQLGADRLSGGAGADRLLGGAGNDLLLGGAGHDLLLGGPGRDVLKAGPGGRDVLAGGAGNDTLDARNHRRDSVNCGPGRDSARVDRADRVRGCERITPPGR